MELSDKIDKWVAVAEHQDQPVLGTGKISADDCYPLPDPHQYTTAERRAIIEALTAIRPTLREIEEDRDGWRTSYENVRAVNRV